jgi:outer membrane protein assembly factor BamB
MVANDVVIVKTSNGAFSIRDRKSGKQLHFFSGGTRSGCCTPAVAGGHAYFGTGTTPPPSGGAADVESLSAFAWEESPREKGIIGTLHVIDLKTGKSVWSFGTGNTICGDPALAYGRLYFTSRDGRVYCFTPAKEGEPVTPEARDASGPAPPQDLKTLLARQGTNRPTPGKSWPMVGGTPDRAGLPGTALKPPLQPAWKVDMGGPVLCGAALGDGKVFVGSDAGKLAALEAGSGKRIWEFPTGAPVRCSPAVVGGVVYGGSDSGTFHALDAGSGKQKWSFGCGGPVQSSPAVVGGVVVFGANDHNVYALDRETGRKLWNFRMREYSIQAPVVVHGEQVFAGQWYDWVWAIDLLTGKEQWRSRVPVSVEAVAFYQDKLYVRSPYYIVELDPRSGKRLRLGQTSYGYGGLAFMKNLLFQSGVPGQYGTSGATVIDLSQAGTDLPGKVATLAGGRRLSSKGLPAAPERASMVAPLVLGETVCFAGRTGKLALTDAVGRTLWSATLGGRCHSPPIAVGGLLVLGCDDGHVYAFHGT